MSWASHRSEKSRRRNTANIDGAGAEAGAEATIPPASPPPTPRIPPHARRRPGLVRPSLASALGDRHALAQQQLALSLETVVPLERAVATVAAKGAVGRDDAVAGHDERQRVPADRPADRPRRPWRADAAGDLAVGRRLAEAELADREEDALVPLGAIREIDRDIRSRHRLACEQGLEGRPSMGEPG